MILKVYIYIYIYSLLLSTLLFRDHTATSTSIYIYIYIYVCSSNDEYHEGCSVDMYICIYVYTVYHSIMQNTTNLISQKLTSRYLWKFWQIRIIYIPIDGKIMRYFMQYLKRYSRFIKICTFFLCHANMQIHEIRINKEFIDKSCYTNNRNLLCVYLRLRTRMFRWWFDNNPTRYGAYLAM